MAEERYSFIDKACGIAMLLVVYGHIVFPETIHIAWWKDSRDFIYKFHMPLFMFLSGFIVFLSTTKKHIETKSEYLVFQKKKIQKFLPPYIFFSLLAILVDILHNRVPAEEIRKSVFSFFFCPDNGSAGFVWYLYVLTGFYLITPFLLNVKRTTHYLLIFLGFLLTNTSFSILFSADLFAKYFFFFLCGGMMFINIDPTARFLRTNGIWIVTGTILIAIVDFYIKLSIPYQLISIAMIASVLYISMFKWPVMINEIFIAMGLSSFAIYLLNTSVLNVYYILFKSVLHIQIDAFFIFSCLICTIAISMFIRTIFNKVIPYRVYSL